jgi:hypothetical protein
VTKNASWQLQQREQARPRSYLFPPIQNIEIQFIAGHMSQRKQLSAAVDLRGSNLLSMSWVSLTLFWHVRNGLARGSGFPVLVLQSWLWVGLLHVAEGVIELLF